MAGRVEATVTEAYKTRPALERALTEVFNVTALFEPHRLRMWDTEGLTVTQLRLLNWVAEEEGLSNADLADRLYVTRPSVSALLERLERGGFLRREISPSDRRGICIWLEPRGREVITHAREEGWQYASNLFDSLTDEELNDVSQALEKLITAGRERRQKDLQAEREREKD